MLDFVLEQNEKIKKEKYGIESYYSTMQVLINYASFLKQHLTLGMFMPCDEDGNPIILDTEHKECPISWSNDEIEQYKQAKEKVLFEGFDLNQKDLSKLENIFCLTK